MYPNTAKRQLWVLPTIAVALVLVASAIFGFSSAAMAQQPAGDYCVEGIVIDWEEQPLGNIEVTLETPPSNLFPGGEVVTDISDNSKDDKGEFKFESPDDFAGAPGLYTASVTLPGPDWEGVTATSFSFRIDAGQDGCVKIRFKLRQIVPVTVYKIDADHTPLVNWTIDAIPGGGNLFAEPKSEDTDINGAAVFTLTPGVWVFTERQPAPEDKGDRPDPYRPVVPPTGRMELDVQPLEEGDPPYILVFKNEFKDNGCVVIRKFGLCETVNGGTGILQENGFCVPTDITGERTGYGAAGWGFELVRTDGTVARRGLTDAEGYLTFDNLPYGPYTIVEEDRPGWAEVTPRKIDVTLDSGQCVLVPFENQQDDSGFCIEGYKLDANGGYGIPNWKIEIEPLHEGGYDEIEETFTDGLGKFRFDFPTNDYRIPGAEFEICEDDDVDGWLPHTPTCQTVTLPMWPGACVHAKDFINQQVGHTDAEKMKAKKDGPSMGGNMPKNCKTFHTVKPGEGLFDIGTMYKVSPQQMLDANPMVRNNPNHWVFVGQALCIP
jgi:hypothetical protein